MVLRFFLLVCVFLFMYCAVPERDDPDDPKSTYYRENANGGSSSENSAKVSSSSVAVPSSSSSLVQSSVVYGTPVTYGGETYETVVIGSQTWMARNLNYNASGSQCGYDDPTCMYGRVYDWATAKTACPSGWSLPTQNKWNALSNYVQSDKSCYSCDAQHLKATSGWNSGSGSNGLDSYGFAALPAEANYGARWWTADEYSGVYAFVRIISFSGSANWDYFGQNGFFGVRCIKD
jgi:uncharacterized protein (TIGR02145 family)